MEGKNAIIAINNALEPFFNKGEGGFFLLKPYNSPNVFRLVPNDFYSTALDSYRNEKREINVSKWFSDYWLFIEIIFQKPKGTTISLSIFQGTENEKDKNQLFRAEWDDYEENESIHPQPHWHFIANKSVENTVATFTELVPEFDTFEELLSEEKDKVVELGKFHFAMNGDWSNTSNYIHPINDERKLAKWFGGLLAYLKQELEYIDTKREKGFA